MPHSLIDSHCHLTSPELLPRAGAVLDRARAAGVTQFVTIATDLADAEAAFALGAKYPDVHAACGIHPHEAAKAPSGWEEVLEKHASDPRVHAVGEMGLDYHYDFADRPTQHAVFRRQIEIAARANRPVIIHCREAHRDVLAILADCPRPQNVVFHCFTGSEAEAAELIDLGYWISLTGVVTFRRSDELRRVANRIPPDRLMIETDCPYLSPEPLRNVRPNEPAHLVHTAACIARARGLTVDELAALTTENARRFFHLPQR
ncbi:MAG: hydrolase TatD [Planctomycetota bacterium]|nr:MAG: hydrolase TatD [Planctomycetota bacterium]